MKFIHDNLIDRLKSTLNRYEQFLIEKDQDSGNILFGIAKTIKNDGENFVLKVGTKQFLLKGEIFLSYEMIYLRTYELVPNLDAYPSFRLRKIDDLDIAMIHNQSMRFVKKIDEPNTMRADPTLIRNFDVRYTEHLWQVIQRLEDIEVPELEKLTRR